VEYPDGRTGFIAKEEAQVFEAWLAGAEDTPERIVATAKRFLGVPYLWGGTSSKGMDCSGFTKTVYYLNGVLLPRDADQQAAVGDSVDVPAGHMDLKPGDLLFFGSHAREGKPERVTHVAISLGGRRFIHSSADVHVNSLDPADSDYSDFRSVSFLRARRIIGAGEPSGVLRLAGIPYYRAYEH
jgi:gamma-D-glutamyl-L-lysine dipeptidyl-peptidase